MSNWFNVERIDSDTFAISEYGHWEEAHSYLLCGRERCALIDTGLGVADIRPVVEGLTRLPVCVLTTHAHWDHIGGHGRFDDIAIHEAEADWLSTRFPLPLEAVMASLMRAPCNLPEDFSIEGYRIFRGAPRRLLSDGDRVELGGRTIAVVHAPGHSPGHCCFFEPERGYLYSGDLIYLGCLDAFYPTTDPIQFARSVRKIRRLESARILPGHHALAVPLALVDRIDEAFGSLESRGLLHHGSGIFDFGDFQIHI